eukprot:scaffold2109_cov123-Isochrysis_galbana.AAC.18
MHARCAYESERAFLNIKIAITRARVYALKRPSSVHTASDAPMREQHARCSMMRSRSHVSCVVISQLRLSWRVWVVWRDITTLVNCVDAPQGRIERHRGEDTAPIRQDGRIVPRSPRLARYRRERAVGRRSRIFERPPVSRLRVVCRISPRLLTRPLCVQTRV